MGFGLGQMSVQLANRACAFSRCWIQTDPCLVATPPSAPINFTRASNSYRVLFRKTVFSSLPGASLSLPGVLLPPMPSRRQSTVELIKLIEQQQPGHCSGCIRLEGSTDQGGTAYRPA
jgi:hypothetical protein